MFLMMFPVLLIVVAAAPEGLRLWLSPSFAENAVAPVRWLAIGVFVSCLAQIPFGFIQSAGRPRVTAMLHILEMPFYLAALWFLLKARGIEGAAIAWAARVVLDAGFLFYFSYRLLPHRSKFLAGFGTAAVGGIVIMYFVSLTEHLILRVIVCGLVLLIFGIGIWFRMLAPDGRIFLFRLGRASETKA